MSDLPRNGLDGRVRNLENWQSETRLRMTTIERTQETLATTQHDLSQLAAEHRGTWRVLKFFMGILSACAAALIVWAVTRGS